LPSSIGCRLNVTLVIKYICPGEKYRFKIDKIGGIALLRSDPALLSLISLFIRIYSIAAFTVFRRSSLSIGLSKTATGFLIAKWRPAIPLITMTGLSLNLLSWCILR